MHPKRIFEQVSYRLFTRDVRKEKVIHCYQGYVAGIDRLSIILDAPNRNIHSQVCQMELGMVNCLLHTDGMRRRNKKFPLYWGEKRDLSSSLLVLPSLKPITNVLAAQKQQIFIIPCFFL